jgi:hypothetical protein
MAAHVVLLFAEPESVPKHTEPSIANELKQAGYRVIEVHNLSVAAALLFVSRTVEAVVIESACDQIAAKFADSVGAIRPGLPLLRADAREAQASHKRQSHDGRKDVMTSLEQLFGQHHA